MNLIDLKIKKMRGVLFPVFNYIRNQKPTVLLACMWPLTVFAILAAKLAFSNTRIFVAEHINWGESHFEYGYFLRLLIPRSMKFFFNNADGVITVSQGAACSLASYARIPLSAITIIYNPVIDVDNIKTSEIMVSGVGRWLNSPIKVLTVGHLKEQKNHDLLLEAFATLLHKMEAHLLILGEGRLRFSLEKKINELGISDRVSMPGFVDDPNPFYRLTNLFVLSSDWEGLPTVLIEALSAGAPIVSTDCPSGPREILCDGLYGDLVPVGDPLALADMMINSLSKDHDRATLINRSEDFSIQISTDKYEKLFFQSSNKGMNC